MRPHLDEARRWLRFAEEDLKVASWALEEGIYTQVCFHAQQCAEKAIKGLIVYQGRVPPKTHRLLILIDHLDSYPFRRTREEIGLLDLFYIPARYPDALPGMLPQGYPDLSIAQQALSIAEAIFRDAKGIIEETIDRSQ